MIVCFPPLIGLINTYIDFFKVMPSLHSWNKPYSISSNVNEINLVIFYLKFIFSNEVGS